MDSGETLALDASLYEGLAGFRYALRQFLAFSEAADQRGRSYAAAVSGPLW